MQLMKRDVTLYIVAAWACLAPCHGLVGLRGDKARRGLAEEIAWGSWGSAEREEAQTDEVSNTTIELENGGCLSERPLDECHTSWVSKYGILTSMDVHPLRISHDVPRVVLTDYNPIRTMSLLEAMHQKSWDASHWESYKHMINNHDKNSPPTVYVVSTALKDFRDRVLPHIKRPFVLVTGDAVSTVPTQIFTAEAFEDIIDDPRIVHWFAQNGDSEHKKFSRIPLGLDYHFLARRVPVGLVSPMGVRTSPQDQEKQLNAVIAQAKPFEQRKPRVLAMFNPTSGIRGSLKSQLADSKIIDWVPADKTRQQWWKLAAEYQFVLSPPGVGFDCHRTWEVLILGSIPIVHKGVTDHLFIEHKLPVLIVKDFSDMNKWDESCLRTGVEAESRYRGSPALKLHYWVDLIDKARNDKVDAIKPSPGAVVNFNAVKKKEAIPGAAVNFNAVKKEEATTPAPEEPEEDTTPGLVMEAPPTRIRGPVPSLIPNTIFFMGPSVPQELVNENYNQIPDLVVRFFDYDAARRSVKDISAELEEEGIVHGAYDAYMMLRPHAYKSDLWRYMILWKFGGIYLDAKVMLTAPLYHWVNQDADNIALCLDADYIQDTNFVTHEAEYWSAMVAARAGAPELAAIIRHIVRNVQKRFYGTEGEIHADLEITGPGALTAALKEGGFTPRTSCSMYHNYMHPDVYDGRRYDGFVMDDDDGFKTRIAQTDWKVHQEMRQGCKHCDSYSLLFENHSVYCDEPGPPCEA